MPSSAAATIELAAPQHCVPHIYVIPLVPSVSGGLLPDFDVHGNLPPRDLFPAGAPQQRRGAAVLLASLAEMRARYVDSYPKSASRPKIWDGWMEHRKALDALGIKYATLVNGSFITDRLDPGDVDLCCMVDAADVNGLPSAGQTAYRALFDVAQCKKKYLCDPYAVTVYPLTHFRFQTMINSITYWSNVFGVDRRGRPKSFVIVTEGGTP